MANNIAFASNYAAVMDELWETEGLTNDLITSGDLVRAGNNAKEIQIPKISVTGLGDYTRNAGYTDGSITFEYETKTFNYDRGTRLLADAMDVEESGRADMFVTTGAELMRTQVIPEDDAFTFATILGHKDAAQQPDIAVSATHSYATADALVEDISNAMEAMDEKSVPDMTRILYVNPKYYRMLQRWSGLASNVDKDSVLDDFAKIVKIPQKRFYSAIELETGKAGDSAEAKFGYKKAAGGKDINWLIVEPSAVIKYTKHNPSRIFSPDELENLDSHMMKFRKYGIVELLDNKLDGIYASVAAS